MSNSLYQWPRGSDSGEGFCDFDNRVWMNDQVADILVAVNLGFGKALSGDDRVTWKGVARNLVSSVFG